jgi:hypothetical protein
MMMLSDRWSDHESAKRASSFGYVVTNLQPAPENRAG